MSRYTRAEVDAEIHKVLASVQEMFERFAASDAEAVEGYRERGMVGAHCNWVDGRATAYRLAADHMDRLKEGYQ
ncbi:MAG: hypothetical protein GY764_11350 [Halieaceae bacterium]|nr:hypothetical protein [Halieaceae bacterium]